MYNSYCQILSKVNLQINQDIDNKKKLKESKHESERENKLYLKDNGQLRPK